MMLPIVAAKRRIQFGVGWPCDSPFVSAPGKEAITSVIGAEQAVEVHHGIAAGERQQRANDVRGCFDQGRVKMAAVANDKFEHDLLPRQTRVKRCPLDVPSQQQSFASLVGNLDVHLPVNDRHQGRWLRLLADFELLGDASARSVLVCGLENRAHSWCRKYSLGDSAFPEGHR